MKQTEIKGTRQILHVLEMPEQTEKIEVRKTLNGWWQIVFIASNIEMTLAKRTNPTEPLLFQSLGNLEKRLIKLGWSRGFYVIQ